MTDQPDFEQLLQQPDRALQLARQICARHHLAGACTRMPDGSQLVFATTEGRIVKIFAPEDRRFQQTEACFLAQLHHQLPLATPRLDAAGEWAQYPYLVMEQLPGRPLNRIWESLTEVEQLQLVDQLGEMVRALHALPKHRFAAAPFKWQPFIDHQQQALLENHRRTGLAPRWLSQLAAYVEATSLDLHDPAALVPLHTELMLEHLFVQRVSGRWILSGLIDFEPAMVGHREYEFCAVGLFITQGNPALFRRFLSAYGYPAADLTAALSRRIMALLLLHRYSNLTWFLGFIPPHLQLTTVAQLERYWFGFRKRT